MKHLLYDLGQPAKSWYEASTKRGKDTPPLPQKTTLKTDVCIIGGGFTGLSAALELALKGREVTVLEARQIGFGASGRNGGQIIGGWHHDYATIKKRFGKTIQKACFDISEEGKQLIENRVKKYNIDCHLKWGYTHLAIKPKHIDSMEQDLKDWQNIGYKHGKLLSHDELGAKLGSNFYIGGLHDDYSGHMHPLRYLLGLADAARKQGVKIYPNTQATHIDCDKGEVYCGKTRRIDAEHVIVAGNAYINFKPLVRPLYKRIMPVISNIGATIPLTSEQQQTAVRDQDAYADYNFIVDYFRMSHDNRLLFGGRASYGGYEPRDMQGWMQKRLGRVFPALRYCPLEFVWGGNIGITMDRYPDVGRIGKRGLYAQGYSGHGVLLSNMCGKILAEAIMGQQDKLDVFSHFKHRNFPGGFLRRPALVLGMLYYRLHDAL